MNEFKITLPTELKPYENDRPSGILREEVSSLTYAIFELSRFYEFNDWSIDIGGERYTFDIGDIPLIWDDIPKTLHECISENIEVTWFEFFEQGLEILIRVENNSHGELEVSLISLKRHPSYWKGFSEHHPDEPKPPRAIIGKRYFLEEWRTFVDQILKLLNIYALIDMEDESVKNYLNQIPTKI